MPASSPILDTRRLQDILGQLGAQARNDLPKWTPGQSGGDAGTMLQRIFARLLDLALQRLNQVPEKNLLAFLDAMGVTLLPPSPAKVPLTFALKAGSPPTLIPKGMLAGTQPSGQQPAVSFETVNDLTVIPAQLAMGFTMDPTWDRYTDQTRAVAGQSSIGFTPFVGTKRMPHILYIGDDILLDFSRATTVEVKIQQGALPQIVRDLFQTLSWQYRRAGALKPIAPASDGRFRFSISERIDEEPMKGIGLTQTLQSRWLRAMLTAPFPDALGAQGLLLKDLGLRVSSGGFLPDLAFNNAVPLDVTTEFLPFGEAPKPGDAFYIASQDAFSKPSATVTLGMELKVTPPPSLIWEYWNADGSRWEQLPGSFVSDGTNSFTRNGTVSLVVPASVPAAGIFLLSMRIANGRYRGFPSVSKFKLIETTKLSSDVNAGETEIQLDYPNFAAPGEVLLIDRDELVQVVRVDGAKVLTLTPMTRPHGKESPVALPELRLATPVGSLPTKATQATNTFDFAVTVRNTEKDKVTAPVAAGDVLKIDDVDSTEYVVATKVDRDQAQDKVSTALTQVAFTVTTKDSLLFDHAPKVTVARVTDKPDFAGLANRDSVDFGGFLPLGKSPGAGDVFRFGSSKGFAAFVAGGFGGSVPSRSSAQFLQVGFASIASPQAAARVGGVIGGFVATVSSLPNPQIRINVEVDVTVPPPDVELQWEFLGANGWQIFKAAGDHPDITGDHPDTLKLRNEGTRQIVFSGNQCVLGEVGGKKSYWIRARIISGTYGLPIDYVAVNPADSTAGFQVSPGTGNLNPPVLTKLTLSYEAERAPTVLTQNGFFFRDETRANPTGFAPFASVKDLPDRHAEPEPSFYLAFDAAFPEQPVRLYVDAAPRAFGGSVLKERVLALSLLSELPRLRWEYFNGTAWSALTVFDGTNSLTESGTLEFLTPTDIQRLARFDPTPRYWIRARSSKNDPVDTQRLDGVFINTVPAVQSASIPSETLGSSNGQAGQTLRFARTPVLPDQQLMVREPEPPSDRERAAIEDQEGGDAIQERTNTATQAIETWVRWHEVANFLASGPHSRHYTLDRVTGLLAFGDGKHGLIPPSGTNNIVAAYRSGGGVAGNLPKGAVAQVKSPISGVAGVTNPVAADGGAEPEAVSLVRDRGPQVLKHRSRAVATADLEWLARQADGTRVARAKCLPNVNRDLRFEPGWATLLIVPQGAEPKLSPTSELIREVENYLAARAFVGLAQQTPMRLNVIGPGYIQMMVRTEVVPKNVDEAQTVKQQVLSALSAFFHPLTGGPDGSGWEFGRHVYGSEVSRVIEGVAGVDHVESLQLIPNIAQHRLTFAHNPNGFLPLGSLIVTTLDRGKAALLAEPADASAGHISIKGFKEGDRITRVLDLKVNRDTGTSLNVIPRTDDVGFPRGSVVMTLDGAQSTRLAEGVLPNQTISKIAVETPLSGLTEGDTLTVFYPFPITITSVAIETIALRVISVSSPAITVGSFATDEAGLPLGSFVTTREGTPRTRLKQGILPNQPGQTLLVVEDSSFADSLKTGDSLIVQLPTQLVGIEPYEPEFPFPRLSPLSTLDNRVRLPLLTELRSGQKATSIRLQDFVTGEEIIASQPNGRDRSTILTIQGVQPVYDIVYLDDNFLVYSGAHQITMVEE